MLPLGESTGGEHTGAARIWHAAAPACRACGSARHRGGAGDINRSRASAPWRFVLSHTVERRDPAAGDNPHQPTVGWRDVACAWILVLVLVAVLGALL